MSQSVITNNANFVSVSTDLSKLVLFNPEFDRADYTNGGGAPVTIVEGTVMGVVNATGKIAPLVAAAADGSQFPIGVLINTVTVAAGATANLTYAIGGDLDESKIVFQNGVDTLATVVSGRRLRERLQSDTKGLKLVTSQEGTKLI